MSQEKAQLIAPQGHFTVPGLNVTGVVTASSFSGNCTGTASSIAQGTNVVVGVMTASSFAGDVFGNAAGLSTTTAGLKLGIVTATSFAGNFTGIGSGLTGTPNIVAGLVTASQFVGNTPGLAGGISAGKNLAAGIVTATTFYGDGSALTGAGSTAYIRQTVRATSDETTINLNDGNIIYYEGAADTTVSFANTSTAEDVTIVRSLASSFSEAYNVSYSTGAVDFDGTGDKLSLASHSDLQIGSSAYTIEFWIYKNADTPDDYDCWAAKGSNSSNTREFAIESMSDQTIDWFYATSGGTWLIVEDVSDGAIPTSEWVHIVAQKDSSGYFSFYVNGNRKYYSTTGGETLNTGGDAFCIAGFADANTNFESNVKISNFRFVKGSTVYSGAAFLPPSAALTNITNTKLLCCQDTSSTTVGAVKPGTITAVGDPSAGSVTVSKSGTNELALSTSITWPTSITWNGGSAPTLVSNTGNVFQVSAQVFNLTTPDAGTTWYGYEEIADESPYELWAWGFNNYGQLGHNSLTVYSSPVQIGSDSNWSSIVSQAYTVGAVKSDGTLWTWGSNTYGQLGQNNNGNGGATNSQSSPVQVPGTTWNAFGWSGMSHQKAQNLTRTDGTLWSWGYSASGGLGINALSSRSSPTQIPGTTWKVGGSFQFYYGGGAIRTDGTLWVWGSNSQGNLGQNDRTNRSSPIQIPGTTWKQATGNSNGLAAIKTDGTLWKWGHGNQGTGVNNRTQYSSPTQIPGTNWSEVTACQSHYLATRTDGTLWTWGMNSNGQLGQNEVQPGDGGYSSPVQIPGSTWRTTGLSGGAANGRSGAIKTDGTMWVWGDNGQGQLGQNNLVRYSSPVQVGSDTNWKYMRFTAQGMLATKGA